MVNRRILWVALLILLVAAFLRVWRMRDAPPGLQHDELFKAQEGHAAFEYGDWRVFYPSNQGHEGGYVWLLALSYVLFGTTIIMIKMPPLWCGLLTLAMLYRLSRDVFNAHVGVLAMGLAAVSFWMVSTNRVGLRANLLPLVVLVVLWGLWHIGRSTKRRWGLSVFTGIALGFAIYTYTASFVLYVAFGIFILALGVFDRSTLKRHFPEFALVGVLGFSLMLPMLNYRLNDPQGTDRVSTINMPYTEMKNGNFQPVLENVGRLLTMPLVTGDPEWRYNVAGRPLFNPVVGVLVYAGFALLFWCSRKQPFYVLLLALALLGLIPSLLTTSAPSFLRSIITLPSIMIFFAVAVDHLGKYAKDTRWIWAFGAVAVVITGIFDGYAYFHTWIQNEQVQAVYRDDLQQLAAYLRERDENLVLVSTTEPAILDPAIYAFLNPAQDTDVMWFNGVTDIVLSEEPRLLFVSPLAPISPAHAGWLSPEMGTAQLDPVRRQDGGIAFDVYRLSDSGAALQDQLARVSAWQVYLGGDALLSSPYISDWGVPYDFPVNFGDMVQLIGVEMPVTTIPRIDNGVDNGLQLQLYLQPLVHDIGAPLSIFVHIVARDDTVVAGRDFLGAPPTSWNPDVIFIQDNYIGGYNIQPGRYYVAMGVYDTATGERLPILDESGQVLGDRIFLGDFEAVSP